MVTREEIDEYRRSNAGSTLVDDDEIRGAIIDDGCSEDYRQMFGQRSRREGWGNVENPTGKDRFKDELAFRRKMKLPN